MGATETKRKEIAEFEERKGKQTQESDNVVVSLQNRFNYSQEYSASLSIKIRKYNLEYMTLAFYLQPTQSLHNETLVC